MDAKLMERVLPIIGLLAKAADHTRLSEVEARQFNKQIDAALTANTSDPEFRLVCIELAATDILEPRVFGAAYEKINGQPHQRVA
jgi:hypothetical protein